MIHTGDGRSCHRAIFPASETVYAIRVHIDIGRAPADRKGARENHTRDERSRCSTIFLASETVDAIRVHIDIGRAPADQIGDQPSGARRAGEADVLMAEGVEDSRVAA